MSRAQCGAEGHNAVTVDLAGASPFVHSVPRHLSWGFWPPGEQVDVKVIHIVSDSCGVNPLGAHTLQTAREVADRDADRCGLTAG